MLEANKPLHFYFNQLLKKPRKKELKQYKGNKLGIPLYSINWSKVTKYLTSLRIVGKDINLYACFKESTNKAPEFHHLLYKAKYPDLATDPKNVMLVGRIESEKRLGPGQ